MRLARFFALTLGLFFFLLHPAARGADRWSAAPPDQLGKVNFPTSCSSRVQLSIEDAVALLHSFQYQMAEQTFSNVAKQEPQCAIAYWGKAMALYHQLWDFPAGKTLKEGQKDIEKAQKLHSTNAREQGFIAAAAAFFQKNTKMTHADRRKAYSAALERFYNENSGDVEISSFYALSLVSLAEEGVDTKANLTRAISILDPLLEQHPDHPGVAHYLIHAADRPELASQGLSAARRYAAIAPDSSHALHMPSHIFVRLGLWQDSIASNIAAIASGAHAAEMHMAEFHYQTHAMDFLNYSYLQSGQEAQARAVIEHTNQIIGASDENKADHRAYLAARTALELHRWKEAAGLPIAPLRGSWQDSSYSARIIGKAHLGDLAGAQADLQKLNEIHARQHRDAEKKGYVTEKKDGPELSKEHAWLLFAEDKHDEALKEMRALADREDSAGVDSLSISAREMLADMLLDTKRATEAFAEYKTALENSPNRFDSLLGAARAAEASGDGSGAQSFYAKLTEICSPGADRPELAEAKTYLAQK